METAREVETISDLASFLETLMRDGQAVVSARAADSPDDAAIRGLNELDLLARTEAAVDLPELSIPAASWALTLFYQLCQFVTCRDLSEQIIHAACRTPCPDHRGPACDWSVDLLFRHLPHVFATARHLSNGDPLVEEIRRLGRDWPFSSVGLLGMANINIESFAGHAGLMRMYVDRILAVQDTSRLGDARIDEQIRADLGARNALAPSLAKFLFPDGRTSLTNHPAVSI
jgi:hypothetical protein